MKTICQFIIWYEHKVWRYLTGVFSYRLKASEIGLTDDLVFQVAGFYRGRPSGCEIYMFNDNVYEYRRGADIDLFIESTKIGYYHHFMLQAKIMSFGGRYHDIKRWSINAQFYKLMRAARKESAFPLYLLYNGMTRNSVPFGVHWGLSIVEALEVKNLRLAQRALNRAPLITFNDLMVGNMKAFHELFCKIPPDYDLPGVVSGKDIYKGYPYNLVNLSPGQSLQEVGGEDFHEERKRDFEEINIIEDRNLARFRIIIKSEMDK
jgi:hypothetical protein